jgi:hypothetical protein
VIEKDKADTQMALSMKFEVFSASIDDKFLIQRLMELYQYDLSEVENADLDSHACFGYS